MLNIQNYIKVESLDEAYELNQKKNNKIIGGMMWMRMGDSRINTAIDLSGLGGGDAGGKIQWKNCVPRRY